MSDNLPIFTNRIEIRRLGIISDFENLRQCKYLKALRKRQLKIKMMNMYLI